MKQYVCDNCGKITNDDHRPDDWCVIRIVRNKMVKVKRQKHGEIVEAEERIAEITKSLDLCADCFDILPEGKI